MLPSQITNAGEWSTVAQLGIVAGLLVWLVTRGIPEMRRQERDAMSLIVAQFREAAQWAREDATAARQDATAERKLWRESIDHLAAEIHVARAGHDIPNGA